MHLSFTAAVLAIAGTGFALPAPQNPPPATSVPAAQLAPALPVGTFDTEKWARPLSLDEALAGVNATVTTLKTPEALEDALSKLPKLHVPENLKFPINARELSEELEKFEKRQGTCSNVRIRREWDSYSNGDRQAFIDGIRCLQSRRPSGQFGASRSRYEDLVALHQRLTPQVHGNAIFLLWHRYYLWTFEQLMRNECGFNRDLPWFDETRYAGRFHQSSIFSARWFGSVNIGGRCVTDGQFANLAINIGPGNSNSRHCLSRNGDNSRTINTGSAMVDACNRRGTYADMAACAEGGAHAWGHNGIGSVMQDVFASPGDPVFFLHHAFVDRNFRIWQNAGGNARITTVGGTQSNGAPLTTNTNVEVQGIRPAIRVGSILNTQGPALCYRYNY